MDNRIGRSVGFSFTRAANVTPYAAGAVVNSALNTLMEIANAQPNNANGFTTLNDIIIVDNANGTPRPDLELWFFDTSQAATNDGATFAPTPTQLTQLVGIVPVPVANWVAAGANSIAQHIRGLNINMNIGALFMVIVVRNAYVPISGEVFSFEFKFTD